ncbi:hypothetical protein FRC03_006649 [Tulasnella sp. 419]|nr:hypothetical protein FRC03_006649 [Tulasnella sp. 419]
MKFGRYLEESQTPEWKKKYINYRLLKKLNKAIQREQNEKAERGTLSSRQDGRASGSVANSVQVNVSPIQTRPRNMRQRSASIMTTHSSMKAQSPGANKSLESQGLANSPENRRHYGTMGRTPPVDGRTPSIRIAARSKVDIPETEGFALPPPAKSFSEHNVPITENAGSRPQLPRTRRASFMAQLPFGRSKQRLGNDTPVVFNAYAEALTSFSPGELRFFEVLEKEVQKVEEFFIQRQREGAVKLAAIKLQFKELVDHRRIYHEYEAMRGKRWSAIPSLTSNVIGDAWQFVRRGNRLNVEDEGDAGTATPQQPSRFDPEDYQSAKKKLKHAIQEHYRYLELLNDFRIINLEAVRKAIKKVEKTTNLRIDGLDITDDQLLKSMIKEIEDIYADRFEGGNLKKARARLRMDPLTNKTHHFSTFISGLNLGLAIPAFVSGVYQVLHPNIREEIPEWKPLLVVYSALAIPSMFSLIIGLNLIAWAHARINYVFIFDLDLRSVLDYREYFEIPSFLFMTLCYAFALSFNRVFDVNPAIWPLVWLLLALLTVTIPLRTVHSSSRSWLIRSIGRLLMPGFGPVGFTDFWMGDQFCSLVYSLSSLFFIGCAYSYDLSDWVEDDVHSKCSLSHHWLAGFFLTSLPSVIRLIQCIKRWLDSGLYIHLINGGKYSSSVLTYALYYYWRNTGTKHRGSTFTTWIFFAVVNSIYTTAWVSVAFQ